MSPSLSHVVPSLGSPAFTIIFPLILHRPLLSLPHPRVFSNLREPPRLQTPQKPNLPTSENLPREHCSPYQPCTLCTWKTRPLPFILSQRTWPFSLPSAHLPHHWPRPLPSKKPLTPVACPPISSPCKFPGSHSLVVNPSKSLLFPRCICHNLATNHNPRNRRASSQRCRNCSTDPSCRSQGQVLGERESLHEADDLPKAQGTRILTSLFPEQKPHGRALSCPVCEWNFSD